MDWREYYKERLVTADQAVKIVKSGDFINVPVYPHPQGLLEALARRRDELQDIDLWIDAPDYDLGWLQADWQDSFNVVADQIIGGLAQPQLDAHVIDYSPMIFSLQPKGYRSPNREERPIDVLMVAVSPPDENGLCSFGGHLWNKKALMRVSKTVLAGVDASQIRTYGANYAHVTEFDYFVEQEEATLSDDEISRTIEANPDPETRTQLKELMGLMEPEERGAYLPELAGLTAAQVRHFAVERGLAEAPEVPRRIGEYVSELVEDGATMQIGMGTPSMMLANMGVFDSKKDMGWHSELTPPGIVDLIQRGIITGARKSYHPDKAIFAALTGARPSEIRWSHNNPLIELYDADYVANVVAVSRNDNMVSINNAVSIDFNGQINSESVMGPRQISGTGGQLDFQMGAVLSKGGRGITLLRSTALGGAVSRIVPQLEEGLIVTVPRTFADTVVTEYGVAQLLGKPIRERARELIAVAHPDFRADLQKAADKLLYP